MIVGTQRLSEDETRRKDSVSTIACGRCLPFRHVKYCNKYALKLPNGEPHRAVVELACHDHKTRNPHLENLLSCQTIHSTVSPLLYGQRTSMMGHVGWKPTATWNVTISQAWDTTVHSQNHLLLFLHACMHANFPCY